MSSNLQDESTDGLLSAKQLQILQYIDENIDEKGYLKSKNVAKDFENLSAKEIGTNMPAIERHSTEFIIERWGYSTGTTWMVKRRK